MTSTTLRPLEPRAAASRGFTLVEVMIAGALGVFILAGVLTANLQIIRGGVRLGQYGEMETQVRRALDFLAHDLRAATAVTWNSASDLTLTIPASGSTTAQVTYAWSSTDANFYRVAGASSATLTGRLELVRGIPALANGNAGVTFARFDRDGVAATTDATTKMIQVTLTVKRSAQTVATTSEQAVSATFVLRNKS